MQIFRHIHQLPDYAKNAVIALGNFDGVHVGHIEVIETALDKAKELKKPAAVMTFEPHPISVLRSKQDPIRIMSFRQKIEAMRQLPIDFVFVVPFNMEFAAIEAEKFVDDILLHSLDIAHVVIGYDFIFGHKRKGSAKYLRSMSQAYGFGMTQLDPVEQAGEIVSSSKIRDYLQQGKIKEAASMLGRPYSIDGKVIEGDARGTALGFPTANIAIKERLQPALGVYAVRVHMQGRKSLDAVANLGKRPTFGDSEVNLEVHIPSFEENIYGQKIQVEFIEFIRPEEKFESIDAFQAQISQDITQAQHLLKEHYVH